MISLLLTVGFAQGYVWVSYIASRRILECQTDAVIGGRYSCAIGAISSLAFLLLVILYWHLDMLSFEAGGLMYLLNLCRICCSMCLCGLAGVRCDLVDALAGCVEVTPEQRVCIGFFVLAIFMAMVAKCWKVALASSAAGFTVLSVYLIVSFSSAWLILSKSRYWTRGHTATMPLRFWGAPVLVGLMLLLGAHGFLGVFLPALVTQVLTLNSLPIPVPGYQRPDPLN